MAGDIETFEAVADALVRIVGVPMLSVKRCRNDPAIVAVFADRGVTIVPTAGGVL
jgi:hypothetical protein